jgi:phi LC3 family holin
MINLKVRFRNPVFIAQLIMAVIVPILGYMGITAADLTTWAALGNVLLQAVSNPYVLGLVVVSVWQTLNDPTTAGLKDSEQALTYTEPKK